jgi:enamine deaminase RidA (YjgF/YER057c/UK114 family)
MSDLKIINPGWKRYDSLPYNPAVMKEGKFLFIGGTTSVDGDGNLVGEGDLVAQYRYIYGKIEKMLDEVGGCFDDIVLSRYYLVTSENLEELLEARKEIFKADFPAATGILVAGLLLPGILIEVEAIAVI